MNFPFEKPEASKQRSSLFHQLIVNTVCKGKSLKERLLNKLLAFKPVMNLRNVRKRTLGEAMSSLLFLEGEEQGSRWPGRRTREAGPAGVGSTRVLCRPTANTPEGPSPPLGSRAVRRKGLDYLCREGGRCSRDDGEPSGEQRPA